MIERLQTSAAQPRNNSPLVKHAQTLVSQTFFGTMLKQMRDSPFKSELFSGGRGGEAFTALFDQQLAQRMSRGVGSKLVNAMVRRIEAKHAYAKVAGNQQRPASK